MIILSTPIMAYDHIEARLRLNTDVGRVVHEVCQLESDNAAMTEVS